MPLPTMHKPIPMMTRVLLPDYVFNSRSYGNVVGVSSQGVFFTYIIELDKEIFIEDVGNVLFVSISGLELRDSEGNSWNII